MFNDATLSMFGEKYIENKINSKHLLGIVIEFFFSLRLLLLQLFVYLYVYSNDVITKIWQSLSQQNKMKNWLIDASEPNNNFEYYEFLLEIQNLVISVAMFISVDVRMR